MPDQDKKLKSTEKAVEKKPPGISVRDYSDLKRLQSLKCSVKEPTAIYIESGQTSATRTWQNVNSNEKSSGQWQESTKAIELEKCSVTYKNERNFSKHPKHQLFQDIFTTFIVDTLTCRSWVIQAPSIHFLRVLICLRLLIKDPGYQEMLHSLGGIESLTQYMETVANHFLNYGEEQHDVDKLFNMTYMFQKLAAVKNQREVIASGAHKTLVNLSSAMCFLVPSALTSLAESPECREKISELTSVENLLVILHEYDFPSKRITAELLQFLCAESVKDQIKIYEGVPVLLSLLQSDHIKLLWSIVWILVHVCEDTETSVEIWIWGGIKQLRMLQEERSLVSDCSSVGGLSSANAAGRNQHLLKYFLTSCSCAALTGLVLNETNAYQLVQANAIYTIAKLILPNKERNAEQASLLQCYAFRTLSFLFSMEGNQHIFKRLFPTDLFEIFIHIGHYVHDIRVYGVSKRNSLKEDVLKQIAESIENMNQNKAPTKHIENYTILEHLGNGAFGGVYNVEEGIQADSGTGFENSVCVNTDFVLAKQKQENCKLASIVGTILYSCLEVVKGALYGEKADVWTAGCIFHQMATLNPAFYSTNMLSLATKIVGAVYEPVPGGLYSDKVSFTIRSCWTTVAEAHPDIVEVSSLLSDVIMKYMDVVSTSHLMLEKKLDGERRTQRYFMEADRNTITYPRQFSILSQKNDESLHISSSRAASCKGEFSENTDLPGQSGRGKDEERTYEAILVEDDRTTEKGIFSELDSEIGVVDNSRSSSSSNLKESAIALARIAVSQRKVNQISDPVQQILIQLHKIIFITQLPPALRCNLKKRIVDRFKKSLFSQQSNPKLKEIKKLLPDSPGFIEPSIFTADWHRVHLISGGNTLLLDDRKGSLGTSGMAEGMTNEQLQTLIEEVLEESGYYSFSSKRLLRLLGFYIMLIHQLSAGSTKIDPMPGISTLQGNKELSSKRRECVLLNNGFGIAPDEVNLPVLQQRLIAKGSSIAH
ncbi:LOW QUALITY PROTEIN: serine/threonine-protein kinase Nek10 [Acridotheres tristis]